jgi:hypothetical protein
MKNLTSDLMQRWMVLSEFCSIFFMRSIILDNEKQLSYIALRSTTQRYWLNLATPWKIVYFDNHSKYKEQLYLFLQYSEYSLVESYSLTPEIQAHISRETEQRCVYKPTHFYIISCLSQWSDFTVRSFIRIFLLQCLLFIVSTSWWSTTIPCSVAD